MRVIVTGASGYIGLTLCRRLLGLGDEVHALLRPSTDTRRLGAAAPALVCHEYAGRTDDIAHIVERSKADVCLHLAGLPRPVHRRQDVTPMIEANVLLSAQLAEVLSEAGIGLVSTGSFSEFDETGHPAADSLYGVTKHACRDVLSFFTTVRQWPAITLTLFDVYGPGDWRDKLLGQLLRAAASGEPIGTTPGLQQVDLVHVSDVVEAYLVAARRLVQSETPPGTHESWLVDTGRRLTLRELVLLLERLLDRRIPVGWGELPYRPRQRLTQLSAGGRLPAWSPTVRLEDGLAELADEAGLRPSHTRPPARDR